MKRGVIWTIVGIILLELFDQGASKTYLVETKNNTNEDDDEADMLLNPEDLNNDVGVYCSAIMQINNNRT